MGAYLSEPMTTKESEDGSGNRLHFGSSSMQGWRASQEDAHNCVAQFDDKSSLYGVYDGHGGAEVAIYVAKHFPDVLKNTEAFLNGDIEKAFIEAYLKIDASIKEPEVLKEIQRLAKLADGEEPGEAGVDEDEENVSELYKEATMPLAKLVAKYQNLAGANSATTGDDEVSKEESTEEKPCSSSKITAGGSGSSSSSRASAAGNAGGSSSSSSSCVPQQATEEPPSNSAPTTKVQSTTESNGITNGNGVIVASSSLEECKKDEDDSSAKEILEKVNKGPESNKHEITAQDDGISAGAAETICCNGNGVDSKKEVEIVSSEAKKSSVETEGVVSPTKRKGKVHPVPIVMTEITDKSPTKRTPSRKATLAGLMAFRNEDDSSDFDSSDSDAPENDVADSDEMDDDDEDSDDEEGNDDSGDEDDDSEDEEDDNFLNSMQEPGFDSGTTAVVSFLRWENDKLHLWVANAGDSRCVVSRGGAAIDMSYDHKPESEEETLRIVKAGGKVTDDGRVNGGLNLSRALGDHTYKQNQTLPPEEQMISPLPTVKHLELNPQEEDEFVVLACDGVWNSMTSQQVVDFIKQRITTAPSLSNICEELFETCLSEDTCGDGTGCDNMTAIIVQLTTPSVKRKVEEGLSEEPSKRPKLDID